jgi:peptidoglycan/LPS O-acetylase OafA/YrhL
MSEQRHWPALDGMRALAVLAVIAVHLGVLRGGYLGVDVFFVLSGFLITSLLIAEWDGRPGAISFRNFYARRVLRLFPALACVVLATMVFAVVLQQTGDPQQRLFAHVTLSALPWTLLFSANFAIVHQGNIAALGAFSHTWSLAVEEQFYLLWPALFVLVMRSCRSRDKLAILLGVAAAAEMICRIVLAQRGYGLVGLYYDTGTHSDGLLAGCALAFWLTARQGTSLSWMPERLARAVVWLAALTLPVLFVIGQQADAAAEITAAVIATAVIVIGVVRGCTPSGLDRVLRARWAVRIGRRSYGLYLWHYVLIGMAEVVLLPVTGLYPAAEGPRLLFGITVGLAATAAFVVADISYRFVELPALRLKSGFSARSVTVGQPRPADAVQAQPAAQPHS